MEADSTLARLEAVLAGARRAPAEVPSEAALARTLGMTARELAGVFRRHVHLTPAAFLRLARVQAAGRALVAGADPGTAARAAGFQDREAFAAAFREGLGLAPEAYQDLLGTGRFRLTLPAGYRVPDLLRFHGRDPESRCERVEGGILRKAYLAEGAPVVLSLAFGDGRVEAVLEGGTGGPKERAGAHAAVLRLLGWHGDPAGFEAAHPGLARGREGLRVPLTLDPFEALVWAVTGQQVNLAFAYALRRDLVGRTGLPAGQGLLAHPDAPRLAALAPEDLQALRFSRRKAEYLLEAARAVAEGRLSLEAPATATGAERALLGLRGCGPWTARYVMMRGFGFADCVPVGDAALTLALQRRFGLPERPDAAATERLMAPFAPHRSLATFHLWASLKGVPA